MGHDNKIMAYYLIFTVIMHSIMLEMRFHSPTAIDYL